MKITDFYVIKPLRSGNFGHVYICFNVVTKKIYAVKIMDTSYIEQMNMKKYV